MDEVFVVAWNTHFGLEGAGIKVFINELDAASFYNEKVTEFILKARPELTEDDLDELYPEEKDMLWEEVKEGDAYGRYDIIKRRVRVESH